MTESPGELHVIHFNKRPEFSQLTHIRAIHNYQITGDVNDLNLMHRAAHEMGLGSTLHMQETEDLVVTQTNPTHTMDDGVKMVDTLLETHPHAKLYGQAGIQDNPGVWLHDAINTLLQTQRIKLADAERDTGRTQLLAANRRFDSFKSEVRDVCVGYFEDGTLCQEESETIAERLSLDPWWGKTYEVSVPVTVTFTIVSKEDLDAGDFADLVNLSLNISAPDNGEVSDEDFSVDACDISFTSDNTS